MGLMQRFSKKSEATEVDAAKQSTMVDTEKMDESPVHIWNFRVLSMILIVSLGGMIFGYDTGMLALRKPDIHEIWN